MLAAKKALHHVLYSLPLAAAQGFEIDTSDQMVIPSLWASSIGLHLINITNRSRKGGMHSGADLFHKSDFGKLV